MKRFYLILVILLIPISFMFTACQSIEKVSGTYKFAELYTVKSGTLKIGDELNGELLTKIQPF